MDSHQRVTSQTPYAFACPTSLNIWIEKLSGDPSLSAKFNTRGVDKAGCVGDPAFLLGPRGMGQLTVQTFDLTGSETSIWVDNDGASLIALILDGHLYTLTTQGSPNGWNKDSYRIPTQGAVVVPMPPGSQGVRSGISAIIAPSSLTGSANLMIQ